VQQFALWEFKFKMYKFLFIGKSVEPFQKEWIGNCNGSVKKNSKSQDGFFFFFWKGLKKNSRGLINEKVHIIYKITTTKKLPTIKFGRINFHQKKIVI
jgi:hypothetical protein